MKTLKNHLGVKIKFDKYIAEPSKVPRSAKILDIFYDENYNDFTLYYTPANKRYIRHSNRQIARKFEKQFEL